MLTQVLDSERPGRFHHFFETWQKIRGFCGAMSKIHTHVYISMFTICLSAENTWEMGEGFMLLFFLKLKKAKLSDLKF